MEQIEHAGALGSATLASYRTDYQEATSSLAHLTGTRHSELAAVLANVNAMAAGGYFTASRLPVIFRTLVANHYWWTTGPLLAADERVSLPGSKIVWEYYPGQGIEIQWLGTFGDANSYYNSKQNTNLRELLSEVIPLATDRAGGIAWEYMFDFDGGKPPWTSGLSQGTALEALVRAGARLNEPAYTAAAEKALGIFQKAPPEGVRVSSPHGAWYAEYSFAPSDRILNGFIQAVVGLYEYSRYTRSPLGLSLFEAGDSLARLEVPNFDTGSWSMYDQYTESSLNYQQLLTEFLQNLCRLTTAGPPFFATSPAPSPTPVTGPETVPGGAVAANGGTTAAKSPATGGTPVAAEPVSVTGAQTGPTVTVTGPIAADAVYCTTASEFASDLHSGPVIALRSRTLPGGARAGVELSLSKIANVSLAVHQGTQLVWTNTALVEAGDPRLLWDTPSAGGTYTLTLSATDLAGNTATTSGTVRVSRAIKR